MENFKKNGEFKLDKDDLGKINKIFCSGSLSDEETKLIIKETYNDKGILVDPHTAVAIGVANKISLEENKAILATAHPAKFANTVKEATNINPELPENLQNIMVEKEKYDKLPSDLKIIKNYILERV